MKLRLRFQHPLARLLGVEAIVLYPFVLLSGGRERLTTELLQHEMIHVRQVRRLGPLRFYLTYLWEYARGLYEHQDHDRAYREISFEAEAFLYQRERLLTTEEWDEVHASLEDQARLEESR